MHVAHLIHGVYLMQTQGTVNLMMFVKALPLCRNVGLWELDPSVDNELGENAGDQTGVGPRGKTRSKCVKKFQFSAFNLLS